MTYIFDHKHACFPFIAMNKLTDFRQLLAMLVRAKLTLNLYLTCVLELHQDYSRG